jgi:26S proteasome regulatory subunit T1
LFLQATHIFFSVDRTKYQIQIPLPPKIDASVTMMQVEEKPDVTYSDVGGCKEQIEKLREVVETPLLSVCISLHPLSTR